MPKYDGTGPQGMGPKTGRGLGPCGGGMGWKNGCGMGMNRGYFSLTGNERIAMLKEQAKYLKEDLETVEKEIASLEK